MSEKYHCRASELIGITNKLHAYFFDRAVFYFGVAIDAEMEAATGSAKNAQQATARQHMILLRYRIFAEGDKGRFRDPAKRG